MLRLAILLCIAVLGALAQTSTGELDVRVMDTSGAVVPGAKVDLTTGETQSIARSLTTNDTGVAAATFLAPGTYTVSVTAPGFQKLAQTGIQVRVGETLSLPVTVSVGPTTDTVTVTGEPPLVEQRSATLAQVTEQREMHFSSMAGAMTTISEAWITAAATWFVRPSTPSPSSLFRRATIRLNSAPLPAAS